MGALRNILFLSVAIGLMSVSTIQAQVSFDLEVDVVLDTVLYDGIEDVPAGYRRYRLYAVLPADDYLMLGVAADIDSDPVIPGFGYNAPCGCYNYASPLVPAGYNNGASIQGAFIGIDPAIAYDTWWTSHISQATPGITVFETPGAFPVEYNSCTDEVVQGALLVTAADPVHNTVQNGRALIGQITTCESFEFKVCVAMQPGLGSDVETFCTPDYVQVGDFCTPMEDPQFTVLDEIECFGDAASIEVLPNDPMQPFTSTVEYSLFQFTGTDTTLMQQQVGDPVFNGITDGNYFVSLVDTAQTVAFSTNTCRDTTEVFAFISPDEIVFEATLTQDNICGDVDEATICFSASGGTGGLSTEASHSNGLVLGPDASDCFGPLSCFGGSGDYTVTVTDDAGCFKDTTIMISCPAPLVLNASATEISCLGYSDAILTATASGGTGTVVMEIPELNITNTFDGSLDFEADSLASGTYSVLITDENGCTSTDPVIVEDPEGVTVTYSVTDVACAGNCDGLILADISGGQLPYIISTTDLDGTPVVSGQLCPGDYIHITEDGNQCLVTDTIEIFGPDTITFSYNVANVPCSGANGGQICVDDLAGGSGTLTPQLVPLPTNSWDGECFNVPAGIYDVLVQDAIGCTSASVQVQIEEPAPIQIIPTITPISCTGAGDGVLIVNALGGSGELGMISPFVFPSLPDTLAALGPDSLMLVVGDSLGCIDSLQVGIPEPDPVDLDVLGVVFPECGGDCTGGIEVSIGGGTGSLALYEDGVSDSTGVIPSGLVNLCAGTYPLFLSDDNGCMDSVVVVIEEPDPLLFDITVQDVTCTGMDDGVAIIGTIGGSGETAWEFVGGAVDVLNLFEGEYFVSAVDTAGCTADSSFFVEADIVTDMLVEIFTSPVTCWQTSDGTATAAVTGGQLPLQFIWSDPDAQTTATAIGLTEDVYSVTVTDNIGCTLGFLATVEPTEECLFIADAITPNGDGINDRWVVGGLEFYPQSEVQVFNRWGQLLFRSKPGTTWWDGTADGALLPASDYYYVITVEPGAEPITGTVTLKY